MLVSGDPTDLATRAVALGELAGALSGAAGGVRTACRDGAGVAGDPAVAAALDALSAVWATALGELGAAAEALAAETARRAEALRRADGW